MVWARIDDALHGNEKIVSISNHALAVYVCSITYCAQNLTDGFLKVREVRSLLALRDVDDEIRDELVDANLWETTETGYHIHDFLAYNRSREQVMKERDQNKKDQETWRQNHIKVGSKALTMESNNGVNKHGPVPGPGPGPGPMPEPLLPTVIRSVSHVEITVEDAPIGAQGVISAKGVKVKKEYSAEYEDFYEVYPRHDEKFDGQRAYDKAVKDGAAPIDLRTGALYYAQTCRLRGTEIKHIKLPASFLNARSYEGYQQAPNPADYIPKNGGSPNGRANSHSESPSEPAVNPKYARFANLV